MLQPYLLYYRNHGIRRPQVLINPPVTVVKQLSRSAVYHVLSEDSQTFIDLSDPLLKGYKNRIPVVHMDHLASTGGNAARNSTPIGTLVQEFHTQHREVVWRRDALKTFNDPLTPVVVNYNSLKALYRYPAAPLSAYWAWQNKQVTLYKTIAQAQLDTTRHHFVPLDVPQGLLPSPQILNIFSQKVNTALVRVFDTPAKLWLLEIWKWIDPKLRDNSVFGALSPEQSANVTFLLKHPDGRYTALNLGYLNSWIKGQPNTTEFSTITQYRPLDVQKVFLKFLITLQNLTTSQEEDPQGQPRESSDDPEDDRPDGDADDGHGFESQVEPVQSTEPEPSRASGHPQVAKPVSADAVEESGSDDSVDILQQLSGIDDDLKVLDKLAIKKLSDKGLRIQDAEIVETADELQTQTIEEIDPQVLHEKIYHSPTPQAALIAHLDAVVEQGRISASDYRKLRAQVEEQLQAPDPYESGKPLGVAMHQEQADLALDKERNQIVLPDVVQDASMTESSLQSFDYNYINHNLRKDVLRAVHSAQRMGVVVRGHTIEKSHTALGGVEIHTLQLKPIDGQPSTIRLKLPIVDDEACFTANGNRYVMRKQRVDRPIRKIGPDQVGISSYFSKLFVGRSEKKANRSSDFIIKRLTQASLSEDPYIRKVAPALVFDNNFEAPYIYNALADRFKGFDAGNRTFFFDHTLREPMVGPQVLQAIETGGRRLVGHTHTAPQKLIVVDKDDQFFEQNGKDWTPIGDIFDILQIDRLKAPIDFAEVKIFSKTVPVGVVMAYTLGFSGLVKFLDARYRLVEGRKQKNLEPYEYAVSFQDVSYIFDRRDRKAALILGGFTEFEKSLKLYPANEFNHKDVYLNVLENKGLNAVYLRELELTAQGFVDPITEGILKELNEPTTYYGLLVRAVEMLDGYHHPDSQSRIHQRIRGYERFAGTIYKELSNSIRQYKGRNMTGRAKIEMSPFEVWSKIMKDPTVKMIEDINPIQNLKMSEVVTYVGEGGRSKDAMNKASRAFGLTDQGTASEGNVDSSDVGVTFYLSANPQLLDQRGMGPLTPQPVTPANLLSTAGLLAPASDQDDPRRVAFVGIQQAHTVAAAGYRQSWFRTGYDYGVGQRTGDMFCSAAREDGVVVSKNDDGITIEYKSGKKKGIKIGRQFGRAEGSIYPHDVVANVDVGQKFKKGDVLAYNTGFFEPDILVPGAIVLKSSMLARTAFYESSQTYEDSCAVSADFASRLGAKKTKEKKFTVKFTENLANVVSIGQKVGPKDVLMLIEDEITSTSDVFDDQSLAELASMARHAPRAGMKGVIDRIEVYYHGDKADMSASLRTLADRSDRMFSAKAKAAGGGATNGSVSEDWRVDGVPLALDKAEVRVYLTYEDITGVGGKIVFGNQLKSTIGQVMDYSMRTPDGQAIDAVFGFRSAAARIVNSAMIIGTTTTLLRVLQDKAIAAYDA